MLWSDYPYQGEKYPGEDIQCHAVAQQLGHVSGPGPVIHVNHGRQQALRPARFSNRGPADPTPYPWWAFARVQQAREMGRGPPRPLSSSGYLFINDPILSGHL